MAAEKEPHEYRASLAVFSETIALADLTAALGSPSAGHDHGDPVSRRKPGATKRRGATWILESEGPRVRLLEDQIEDLVMFSEEHRGAFDALAPRPERHIFCGVFSGTNAQGGFALEPALMRRLADLDLVVVFDLY